MILVFLILAGVLIWALCKTDTFSRKSKSGGDDLERLRREWESQGPQEPAQGSGTAAPTTSSCVSSPPPRGKPIGSRKT